MRLIDADKLRIIPGSAFDVMPVCDISSAPTVEAIPVEWLREQRKIYQGFNWEMSVSVIDEIIDEWEKENDMG